MGKILIVEDNHSTRDALIWVANKLNPDIEILSTGFAEEALGFALNNEIEAFFFDIQLEDYSGLELAKQIRVITAYQFTPIVFITAMPTRELEAFRQIHCYDYIIKPFTEAELEKVFKKILIDYGSTRNSEKNHKLSLDFKSHTQLISLKEILYIEYFNRKIVIHTKKEVIQYIHVPLKQIKTLLPDYFIQIHQSFIVNFHYIKAVKYGNQCVRLYESENELPIGRSYMKEMGERINELC